MTNRGRFRTRSSYARRPTIREPYDAVLIVCEGSKTEPNYFRRVQKALRLTSVQIKSAKGSDPGNVVDDALEGLRNDSELVRAYCVFDRDSHANFQPALARAHNSAEGQQGRLIPIISRPCFEVWVLLHFAYYDAPFAASGGRSACENVIREIRAHLPAYQKSLESDIAALFENFDNAIRNSARLAANNLATGSMNPATAVHELAQYLKALRA